MTACEFCHAPARHCACDAPTGTKDFGGAIGYCTTCDRWICRNAEREMAWRIREPKMAAPSNDGCGSRQWRIIGLAPGDIAGAELFASASLREAVAWCANGTHLGKRNALSDRLFQLVAGTRIVAVVNCYCHVYIYSPLSEGQVLDEHAGAILAQSSDRPAHAHAYTLEREDGDVTLWRRDDGKGISGRAVNWRNARRSFAALLERQEDTRIDAVLMAEQEEDQ